MFLLTSDGELELLEKDMNRPNGLAFNPDESILYVDDSEEQHVLAFDCAADGKLSNRRVFCDMKNDLPGVPDGMKIDENGVLYVTGGGGVWVIDPEGHTLGRVEIPEVPSNLAFGDPDHRTLYITARTSVYSMRMKTAGTGIPGAS